MTSPATIRLLLFTIVYGTFAATTAGCGGGAMPRSCTTFTACGGNVVGTWNIDPTCLTPQSVQHTTCGEDFDLSQITYAGQLTFRADGTLTSVRRLGEFAEQRGALVTARDARARPRRQPLGVDDWKAWQPSPVQGRFRFETSIAVRQPRAA